MAIGRKTGGRKTGTPNKRTQEVCDKLESLGCDPVEGMARIAMDENNPMELRAQMYRALTEYVAPKRKAIEQTTRKESSTPSELIERTKAMADQLNVPVKDVAVALGVSVSQWEVMEREFSQEYN